MANELQINLPSIVFAKSGITINITPSGILAVTVTGVHTIRDIVALSTTDTNLSKGNVGTIGWVFVWNHDATNNILIGADGTTYQLLLYPGEYAVFRWNQAAFHAKSAAGTPQLEYVLIEN